MSHQYPKQNELFKWKKGAKRLSDWMEQGGFAPIDPAIQSLKPPTLVACLTLRLVGSWCAF